MTPVAFSSPFGVPALSRGPTFSRPTCKLPKLGVGRLKEYFDSVKGSYCGFRLIPLRSRFPSYRWRDVRHSRQYHPRRRCSRLRISQIPVKAAHHSPSFLYLPWLWLEIPAISSTSTAHSREIVAGLDPHAESQGTSPMLSLCPSCPDWTCCTVRLEVSPSRG